MTKKLQKIILEAHSLVDKYINEGIGSAAVKGLENLSVLLRKKEATLIKDLIQAKKLGDVKKKIGAMNRLKMFNMFRNSADPSKALHV